MSPVDEDTLDLPVPGSEKRTFFFGFEGVVVGFVSALLLGLAWRELWWVVG